VVGNEEEKSDIKSNQRAVWRWETSGVALGRTSLIWWCFARFFLFFVETMACLVSGGVGLFNTAFYGLFAIGWSSYVFFILLFGLGKK